RASWLGLRCGVVLRAQLGRIRRHSDIRRQPSRSDPNPPVGDIPAAGDRRRCRRRPVTGACRRRCRRRRTFVPPPRRRPSAGQPSPCPPSRGNGSPVTFHLNATLAARSFDVRLELGETETIAILGPNGAGKSTLLSIISGLLCPDTGKASIGDKVLFDLAADRSA